MLKAVSDIGPLQLADYGISFVTFPRSLAALVDGDVVYLNTSGWVGRAAANASSTMRGIGVAAGANSSGTPARLVTQGVYHSTSYNFSGFIGGDLFTPLSVGAPTPTQPTLSGQVVQVIGQAVDGSGLYVQVQGTFQKGGTLL